MSSERGGAYEKRFFDFLKKFASLRNPRCCIENVEVYKKIFDCETPTENDACCFLRRSLPSPVPKKASGSSVLLWPRTFSYMSRCLPWFPFFRRSVPLPVPKKVPCLAVCLGFLFCVVASLCPCLNKLRGHRCGLWPCIFAVPLPAFWADFSYFWGWHVGSAP